MAKKKQLRSTPTKSKKTATVDLSWRQGTMARVMSVAVQRMHERVISMMIEAGYTEMRLAHVNLTRNLDLEGNTITELANRASMTKQAMGELVDQCESIDLVKRTADPNDRRVWIVKFTDSGLVWLGELKKAVDKVEAEMIEIIGDDAFDTILGNVQKYNRSELPKI